MGAPAALMRQLQGGDALYSKSSAQVPILPADYKEVAKNKKKKKIKKRPAKAKAKATAKMKPAKEKLHIGKDKTKEAAKKDKTKEEAPKETEAKKTLKKKKKTNKAKAKMKHAEEMKVGEDKRETEVNPAKKKKKTDKAHGDGIDPDDDAEAAKESMEAAFARYSLLWGKEDPAALKAKVHRYVYEWTKKRAERKLNRALDAEEKAECTQAGREAVKAWTSIA